MTQILTGACVLMVAASLMGCDRGHDANEAAPAAGTERGPSAATTPPESSSRGGAETVSPGDGAVAGPIRTSSAAAVGQYLTDANGRALYIFKLDSPNVSRCTADDGCAEAWPPYLSGSSTPTDPAVQAALLGTISRPDHRRQSTYNGLPVYYYEDDEHPGDINGQGKLEFGGLWYLLSPSGREIVGTP